MSAFLLLLAAVFCMGSGSVLTFGVLIARHRRYRERQRASLMAHMERHPAGKRIRSDLMAGDSSVIPAELAQPVRAECGAWIGTSNQGYWDIQFAGIAHVTECTTCRFEMEGKAA